MRVFRVQVRGHFTESPDGDVKSAVLDFLVDHDSRDAAFASGPEIAETVAQIGPKWVSFETLSAEPIEFPYMIADTTKHSVR